MGHVKDMTERYSEGMNGPSDEDRSYCDPYDSVDWDEYRRTEGIEDEPMTCICTVCHREAYKDYIWDHFADETELQDYGRHPQLIYVNKTTFICEDCHLDYAQLKDGTIVQLNENGEVIG